MSNRSSSVQCFADMGLADPSGFGVGSEHRARPLPPSALLAAHEGASPFIHTVISCKYEWAPCVFRQGGKGCPTMVIPTRSIRVAPRRFPASVSIGRGFASGVVFSQKKNTNPGFVLAYLVVVFFCRTHHRVPRVFCY